MLTKEKIYSRENKAGQIEYFVVRKKFLGKTEDFIDKMEERFEKKHLRAYLKGKSTFRYGFHTDNSQTRQISWHKVKQSINVILMTEEDVKKCTERFNT